MALVQSEGVLVDVERPWSPAYAYGASTLYAGLVQDYATIYRTQPAVQTVVAFLARNIAQLKIHAFRRIDDTDRERLTDHKLARALANPNPFTTQHRQWNGTVADVAIYGNGYWAKMKSPGGTVGFVRLPPPKVAPIGENWIRPDGYRVQGNRGHVDLAPEQIVHFRLYDPEDGRIGLPPLESLRRILAEDQAAGSFREQFWLNGARVSGIIKRPAAAPDWSDTARDRFRQDWKAKWAGGSSSEAGGTPILEDDMDYVPTSFSARDSEFISARKLTREETAAAYFVPPPMVGILDHATFSNIEEQHKNLYQDTIGPWLSMFEQDIELQTFADFTDTAKVYVEFNIAEKLKGTFEEQASVIQTLTGAPVMARNEGRARLNLPRIDDPQFDAPVTPLNVLVGPIGDTTPAGPISGEPTSTPATAARTAWIARKAKAATTGWIRKTNDELTRFFRRQESAVIAKLGTKSKAGVGDIFDPARWDKELSADLFKSGQAIAQDAGTDVAATFDGGEYDVEKRGLHYLTAVATVAAQNVNAATHEKLGEALAASEDPAEQADAVRHVFEVAATARAAMLAQSWVTTTGNFGRHEAARDVGAGTKTWVTTSPSPRQSHAEVDGESVKIDDLFSLGGRWPGDPALPVAEVAGCTCLVAFG